MKIIIDDNPLKIKDFINYLIENYDEKNKTYDFELIAEDKYDKRFIIEKELTLNDKVLVLHNDGYDIFDKSILDNFDEFKNKIENLMDSKDFENSFTLDNFKKQFIYYQLIIKDFDQKQELSFHFLNVAKTDS